MHGIGNDFVLIDETRAPVGVPWEDLAISMCRTKFGIGADGLLILTKGDHAPLRMDMINADGSNGGMCGNGLRCCARYAFEHGLVDAPRFDIEIGRQTVSVDVAGAFVTVQMGESSNDRDEIGLAPGAPDPFIEVPVSVGGRDFPSVAMSMANPHWIVFVDDLGIVDPHVDGPRLEHNPWFLNRTNVQFVEVLSPSHVKICTWERGAGATLACGSGSCAAIGAAMLTGRTGPSVTVDLPGGTLHIEHHEDGFTMKGPATYAFNGTWQGLESSGA